MTDQTTDTEQTPPASTPAPPARGQAQNGDDVNPDDDTPEAIRKKKQGQPIHFEDLSLGQKLIMMLFMMLFMNSGDADVDSGKKPATPEQDNMDKLFASILGVDNPSDVRRLRSEMSQPGHNWRTDMDLTHVNIGAAKNFSEAATGVKLELGDRQKAVMSVMDDAAKSAGISENLLSGIWGIESHFGKSLTSPTGCTGDFQFTKGTWASMIKGKGGEIANRLELTGHHEEAEKVRQMAEGLKNGSIKTNDAGLQAMRNDPRISTYAAAYYLKDVANSVHADAKAESSFGLIYAGYNIGPGGARKLQGELAHSNALSGLGYVAAVNPQFFKNNATGEQALANYQATVMSFVHSYDKNVAGTSFAKTQDGNGATISAKPPFDAVRSGTTVAANTPAPDRKLTPGAPAPGTPG